MGFWFEPHFFGGSDVESIVPAKLIENGFAGCCEVRDPFDSKRRPRHHDA
jgi:hypothetical protein